MATLEAAGEFFTADAYEKACEILFAEACVEHDPAPEQDQGREGFKAFFRWLYTAFPDAEFTVEKLEADDEHLFMAYRLSGTHRGDFHGVPGTGRRIDVRGMEIARFADGQVVERWGSTDELGILKQIGAFG